MAPPETRRYYSKTQKAELGKDGKAFFYGGDWHFPTVDRTDLASAVKLVGQAPADQQDAIRRYLIRRAKALDCLSLIPDSWHKGTGKVKAPASAGLASNPNGPSQDGTRGWHDETHEQHVGEALSHAQRCASILGDVLGQRDDDDPTGDDHDDGSSSAGDPNAAGLGDMSRALSSHATFAVRTFSADGAVFLEGTPTVYNFDYQVPDKYGTFTERMAPGAAGGCVKQDVMFLFDHRGLPLARTPATLTLWDTPRALRCRATLNDSQVSRDLLAAILAGNVTAMSIGMVVEDDDWNSAYTVRLVKRIGRLIDVSAVGLPANPATEIWVAGSEGARQRDRAWARRRLAQLRERRAA